MITTIATITTINNDDDNNTDNMTVATGVCKINGVVIVVSCCYSMRFSKINNKNDNQYVVNCCNWS